MGLSRSTTISAIGGCGSTSLTTPSQISSFYVLIPSLLREQSNRLGGKIGMHLMERHKMFQIDRPEDIKLCAAIMRSYGYA